LFHEDKSLPEGYVGNLGYPSHGTNNKGYLIVKRMTDKVLDECSDFLKPSCKS